MTLDALAFESQFLDHLTPVWLALPEAVRGRFLVAETIVDRAIAKGIPDPAPVEVMVLRGQKQAPPQNRGNLALVASIGDIKIGRRLGYGPFAFLEHGAGQSYGQHSPAAASYAGGPDRSDNELFLVPNEYSAALWRSSYPNARVEVVGCPRLDGLPRREPGPPTVAISFHWPNALPYMGTALGDFQPMLPTLAGRFNVIGHAHPKFGWPEQMERLYRRVGIPFVADFDDVCRQADVYIADNTSTLFEFAATGRPVVVLNAAHWSRKGGPGLRFWEAADVGVNVSPKDDLIVAVERALEDGPEERANREAALDMVYPVRLGGAALAADAVLAWLRSKVEVAA